MTLGMKEMVLSRLSICTLFAGILMTDYIMQKLFFNQFCRNICFFKWLLAECNVFISGSKTVNIWIVIVECSVVFLYMLLHMVRDHSDQLEKRHRAGSEVPTDVFQQYPASAEMRPQVPRPQGADSVAVPGGEGDCPLPAAPVDADIAC